MKKISFRIEGGQKVGVCGRTGSGKSTLMLLLFRLVTSQLKKRRKIMFLKICFSRLNIVKEVFELIVKAFIE